MKKVTTNTYNMKRKKLFVLSLFFSYKHMWYDAFYILSLFRYLSWIMSKKSNKHLRNSQLYPIDRKLIFFNDHVNDYLIFFVRKEREGKR